MAASMRPPSRPLPNQRDGPTNPQTRNKENISSLPSTKPSLNARGRSFIPSLVQSSDKSDFFTDSYLEDDNASQTSLIPSPLPQSTALSRPRRKVLPIAANHNQDLRPKPRPIRSETTPTHRGLPLSPQKSWTRGGTSVHSTGLSTPPRSRDGSLTESPVNTQFSSPPRALTETYERIDQEEDLAATEGEISDPESEPAEALDVRMFDNYEPSRQASDKPLQAKSRSPGITPTNSHFQNFGRQARSEDLTTASVLSDPTGMSFVNQLSDPNLARALTPHVLQSTADKDALRRIWDSKRPIAFGKASNFHLDADEPIQSVENAPQPLPQRLIAFSKAGKRKLAGDLARFPLHQRTFSDITDRLEPATQEIDHPVHNDNWHNDDLRKQAMPHNPRLHRASYFPQPHGFPQSQRITGSDTDPRPPRQVRSESPFAQPFEPLRTQHANQGRSSQNTAAVIRNVKFNQSEPDLTLDSRQSTHASSDLDWMQVASEKPVPMTEANVHRRSRSRLSDAPDPEISPEKSRRFDIDFTGQSFQVSESPPLRTRSLLQDSAREKEIIGLAKRGVTTNRLSQLRARESSDNLRQASSSHVPEMEGAQKDKDYDNLGSNVDDESLSNTPVVKYRSSSNSNERRISSPTPAKPSFDRSQSHDLLQRLSRQSSSTPRSSTPSEKPGAMDGDRDRQSGNELDTIPMSIAQHEDDDTIQGPANLGSNAVRATPRVTGAWTDTILPDTIKTVKQTNQRQIYAQTPHINAGGWIDTPAPPGQSQSSRLEPVLESTQEIPEELMNGIVKDSASGSDRTILASEAARSAAQVPAQLTQSLAKKVLAEAKGKLMERGLEQLTSNADDSLLLGNATIQSLENVLDMDETDMTILSRIGEDLLEQTDTILLDRLSIRINRLQTNIHNAQKGLSKLESQIVQPEEQSSVPAPPVDLILCGTCSQPQITGMEHTHLSTTKTNFPFTLLNVTLPIPILYRTTSATTASKWRLPRPTPIGWLVIVLWTWYILECTLAELYSHPVYASHYVWPTEREPDFPFVLPTMLWRWSHLRWVYPYLVQPLVRTLVGLLRVVGMWLGLIDGFADGPGDVVQEVLVETVYRHAENVVGVGLNVMNDELV